MPRFKHYNYDQDTMVVINYQEQLQPGTFEHAVHYLIEHKLDLSVFHPKYRNDDTGRLAYDPAILLKIILFAYSKGITSSREIQWCCETNIIFKALSCDTVPHFTTLAKFVSQHADEIEELFEQILLVCHEQGLLGNELFAIDGCKSPAQRTTDRKGKGRQVSYTLELRRGPTYTDWMKHRVDSQQGKAIYGHRMSVVEPVFGNIGSNKGLNRFSLRSKKKVQGQWQLYCLVHNIEKLANYGLLAA